MTGFRSNMCFSRLIIRPSRPQIRARPSCRELDNIRRKGLGVRSESYTNLPSLTPFPRLGVTNAKGVLPPSNDPHDYLSWAPYHWPDCNWCSNGRTHLSHTGNDTSSSNSTDTPEAGVPPPPGGDITGPPAEDLDGNQNYLEERRELKYHKNRMNRVRQDLGVSLDLPPSESTTLATGDLLPSSTISSDATLPTITADPALAGDPQAIFTATSSLPTTTMDPLATSASTSEETPTGTASFSDMPQAAAHTSAKPKCTPSPTKSLAPSASKHI